MDDPLRYKTLHDLSRIFSLFETPSMQELSMVEIARSLKMLPSKASRMLRGLHGERLLDRNPDTGKYRVSSRFLRLGLLYALNHPLRAIILPHLQVMATDLGLSAGWAIFENGNVVVIDRLQVGEGPLIHLLGTHVPLHASSYGKLFLAYAAEEERERLIDALVFTRLTPATVSTPDMLRKHLRRVREKGYALDVGESRSNITGLAAPVFNREGNVVASVTIAGETSDFTEEKIEEVADYLMKKTQFISRQLGHRG
jgi:DNA-binding IclR family transcriptional regulator